MTVGRSSEMNGIREEETGSAGEAHHSLMEQWLPVSIDDDDTVMPSFASIKSNTMRDLYGMGGNDKSPKGSVDVAVRPLVDLINVHPSFATLSSCSGRVALFDPHMKRDSEDILDEDESVEDSVTIEKSGKGHGVWLLASHEEVQPSILVDLLDKPGEARDTLIFKHEPLLLHVAASSLTRGRQLLSLALQLGFRESGLVVSSNRVTVAIRGHSLALCVPLARQGPLRPSSEYLEALIQESNARMRTNQEKLTRLYQMVQEKLFRPASPKVSACATVRKLPALNLWGHATVAVPIGSNGGVDVLVFGGYGEGPDLSGHGHSIGKRCCRSNRVYCLRHRNGTFKDQWGVVRQETLKEKNVFVSRLGVVVLPVDFAAREGLDACLLPTENSTNPVVALWGGRSSPGKPFDDLILYEPFSPQSSFMKPLDVRGTLPEARWGHSFTALSGKDGLMAVLVGGRNEQTTFRSVHVLTLIVNESAKSHFHWTKLDLVLPPRFHHTSVVADDSVFVFGGLSDGNDLLESFSCSYRSSGNKMAPQQCISAFHVGRHGGNVVAKEVNVVGESMNNVGRLFCGAGCVVNINDTSGANKTLVLLTGGVSTNASETETMCWVEIVSTENDTSSVSRCDIKLDVAATVDFGSMVHHCCVSLPLALNCAEMVLLGGGVSSFAFGPSFAEYVSLSQ